MVFHEDPKKGSHENRGTLTPGFRLPVFTAVRGNQNNSNNNNNSKCVVWEPPSSWYLCISAQTDSHRLMYETHYNSHFNQ